MGGSGVRLTAIALLLSATIATVHSELTPPYFNLAEGRKITASATCGVDTDGPELYCKLVGANTENEQQNQFQYQVIQGQVSFSLEWFEIFGSCVNSTRFNTLSYLETVRLWNISLTVFAPLSATVASMGDRKRA